MRAAIFALLVSLPVSGAAGAALAPNDAPAPTADGLAAAGTPLAVSEAAPLAGAPDEPEVPLATFSYYSVLGMQLQPRVSATGFGYDFNGCLHISAGTDNRLTFPLLIPDGSEVKFLRIYYNDTNAGVDLTAWLTRYSPGQTSTDLTSVNSTGSGGYGTTLSPELFEIFDSSVNYTITVATNTTTTSTQICGVRVAYYAPLIFRDGFETGDTTRWSLAAP
ncbi:MAG: hypothetical protein F9K18_09485 [Thermoanaerobaculia bacterium]|nr:MAG: hypothetical protein F9K18_09485 [Thermoanaerobaculia bacterium]